VPAYTGAVFGADPIGNDNTYNGTGMWLSNKSGVYATQLQVS
jgi:hypothetical protein